VKPVGQLLEPRDDVVVTGVELAEDRGRIGCESAIPPFAFSSW